MSVDWSIVRDQMMLDSAVAMLNTGSFGPVPKPVFDAANRFRQEFAAGPTNFVIRLLPEYLWQARLRVSAFLNVKPERFLFDSGIEQPRDTRAGDECENRQRRHECTFVMLDAKPMRRRAVCGENREEREKDEWPRHPARAVVAVTRGLAARLAEEGNDEDARHVERGEECRHEAHSE